MKKTALLTIILVLTVCLLAGCRRGSVAETSSTNHTGTTNATETTGVTQPSSQPTVIPSMPNPTLDTNAGNSTEESRNVLPDQGEIAGRGYRSRR